MLTRASSRSSLAAQVKHYAEDLRSIASEELLIDAFHKLVIGFGFRYFAISGIPLDGSSLASLLLANNLPEEWVAEYIARNYAERDPIIRRCVTSHDPFYWDDACVNISADSKSIMRRATELGLTHGVCIPIHNINGFEAGVSMSGAQATLPREELQYLYLASLLTFSLLRQFKVDHSLSFEDVSSREVDVLTWSAVGKTSKEIAHILGISENTVNVHMKNAIRKLSAKNKTEAVAIAARRGVISV